MTIASLDDYIASTKQVLTYFKSNSITTVAGIQFSLFNLLGSPGSGVLGGSNTSIGVIPDANTAGTPNIYSFNTGSTGYLSTVDFASTVAGRLYLYDMVWKGGPYNFNSVVTVNPPSYSGRMPDFNPSTPLAYGMGNQIWLETVTAFTGLQTANISYTNAQGTAGQFTGNVATGVAPGINRMFRMPLAAGDNGVSNITAVRSYVSTIGTFNVLVLRPLWQGRIIVVNGGDCHGIDKTGLPIVYANSALFVTTSTDSTSSGVPELQIEFANK